MAYCNYVLNASVDGSTQKRDFLHLKYVWVKRSDDSRSAYDPLDDVKKDLPEVQNSGNLHEFLLAYVCKPDYFYWDASQGNRRSIQWNFFLKVLNLTSVAYRFGWFKRDSLHLIPRFRDILDVYTNTEMVAAKLNDEEYALLMKVKIEVCRILVLYLDLELKKNYESFLNEAMGNSDFPTSTRPHDVNKYLLKKLAKTNLPTRKELHDPLALTLLKLIKHENDALTSLAVDLLVRIKSDGKTELYHALEQVKILIDPGQINIYNDIVQKLNNLRVLTSAKLDKSECIDIKSILDSFVAMCDGGGKPNKMIQRILFSEDVHSDLIFILKLALEVTDYTSDLFASCYELISAFCWGNSTNQQVMARHMDLLLRQRERFEYPNLMKAITSIIKGNARIATRIAHHPFFIQQMRIMLEKPVADHLKLLKTMVAPSDAPIRHNQSLILDMILSTKLPLQLQLPSKLKAKELDPENKISVTAEMLKLLSLCVSGRIQDEKSRIQKLITFDQCLQGLKNAEYHPDLESAYATLFCELYLKMDQASQMTQGSLLISGNDPLWSIMDEFSAKLVQILKDMERSHAKNFSHSDKEYIIITCAFFDVFFNKYYQYTKSTPQQTTVSNHIFDALASLSEKSIDVTHANSDEHLLSSLYKALTSVKEAGILGLKWFSGVDPIVRSLTAEIGRTTSLSSLGDEDDEDYQDPKVAMEVKGILDKAYAEVAQLIPFDEVRPSHLEILVFQLGNSLHKDNKLKLACLRILISKINATSTSIDFQTALSFREVLQDKLDSFGCPIVTLFLLASKDQGIVFHALELMVALLDKGNMEANKKVRQKIMEAFTSRPDETFFRDIFQLVDKNKTKIRRKNIMIRRERRNTLAQLPSFPIKVNRQGSLLGSMNFLRGRRRDRNVASTNSMIHAVPMYAIQSKASQEDDDYLLISNVLTLLQLMCTQDSLLFSNYTREQLDNPQSYDVLRELVSFLKVFAGLIRNATQVDMATKLYSTLTSLITNNPANQLAVVIAQVVSPTNAILAIHATEEILPGLLALKTKALEFMLQLLEPPHPTIVRKIVTSFELKNLEDATSVFIEDMEPSEQEITVASLSYRFIKALSSQNVTQNARVMETEAKIEEYCRLRIGRVEVVNEDNGLETLYFPIPKYFIPAAKQPEMRRKSEQDRINHMDNHLINNQVDWNQATDRLDAFSRWAENQLVAEEYNQKKEKSRLFWILNRDLIWRGLSFILTLALNAFIIAYGDNTDTFQIAPYPQNVPIYALSIVHLVFSAIVVASFFYKHGPRISYRGLMKYIPPGTTYMLEDGPSRRVRMKQAAKDRYTDAAIWIKMTSFGSWQLYYGYIGAKSILTDQMSLFYIFYLIFSILGLAVSPFFFCYHMLQILLLSPHLKTVISAFRLSVVSLLWMALFIIEVIYIWSIIAMTGLSIFFVETSGLTCDTLVHCFFTLLYWGVPSQGGLYQYMSPPSWWRGNQSASLTAFSVGFFITIAVLLLNIVLAIIVDTFGELRDNKALARSVKSSRCFVCSIERETFKRKGVDFGDHVTGDHNILNYLYFFGYLKKTPISELTTAEAHVRSLIQERSLLKFFPIERSRRLEEVTETNAVDAIVLGKLSEIERMASIAAVQQDHLLKENIELKARLTNMAEEMASMKTMRPAIRRGLSVRPRNE
eukprot:TRINITY_DN6260_c0_g1_i1.p1 TRINITY_DN6260_c0_g1~~TRINITY_DN6260_c0_g1_i1.p1  ORF type:complete len:1666 (-),score=525.24 TRINITY_DN6260_c0_g1_i1:20-5017(-)